MENNFTNNFLQSEEWRKFQKSVGRKTFNISIGNFKANIIEHKLSIAGNYFYIPKGPILSHSDPGKAGEGSQEIATRFFANAQNDSLQKLIKLAKKEKAGWIRFDPADEKKLEIIKNSTTLKITKAPHDVQPKQIFVIDISRTEEEILAQMKSKTRYNIKLAQKRGVSVQVISNFQLPISNKYVEEFLRLTKIMAKRQGITPHPDEYYRKMLEIIPKEMIKLYVAEFDGPASTRGNDRSSTRGGKIIAANLMIFYGDMAIYLHGASDDKYKNLMAPHLLQWRAIQDAKKVGCVKYDFGGVRINEKNNLWAGITRFKLGFAPNIPTVEFPGSYDIVISPVKYWILYRIMQKMKSFVR